MLDEETDQTVEEIEMIKSMLEAVQDDDASVLDRPTHTGKITVIPWNVCTHGIFVKFCDL